MQATVTWLASCAIVAAFFGLIVLAIDGPAWAAPAVIFFGITFLCVASDLSERRR